ncbi:hypothetical protein WN51_07987 [Melipona quadrifasciata]|uniref:Uncharacterized protein n=1 Tax=Melipona quadrifasciata TaxID=166423 RepID=A0A0M8ZN61_9HYME|nr:hypothetical protein WN51_07987 [Melipona quadrifasciata]
MTFPGSNRFLFVLVPDIFSRNSFVPHTKKLAKNQDGELSVEKEGRSIGTIGETRAMPEDVRDSNVAIMLVRFQTNLEIRVEIIRNNTYLRVNDQKDLEPRRYDNIIAKGKIFTKHFSHYSLPINSILNQDIC